MKSGCKSNPLKRSILAPVLAVMTAAVVGAPWLRGSGRVAVSKATLEMGRGVSQSKADALQAKLQMLSARSLPPGGSIKPLVITDDEANSYLKYRGGEFLPDGVSDTILHIMPKGIQGTAIVNFDKLKLGTNQDDLGSKVLSYIFQGKQRVWAFGELQSGQGKATLQIKDVRIGTTQLNDWLVNWLLQYYLQSKLHIDLSKPLPLPDHVVSVDLSSGQATLMRSASKH